MERALDNRAVSLLNNKNAQTHGMSRSPEYQAWNRMRNRCNYPNDPSFDRYGGRGIKVCLSWMTSFENFIADMGPRPGAGYSVERIDNNGDYEPGNCVWADAKTQARNRRNNRTVSHNGETMTISGWSEATGIPKATIRMRLERGWSVEDTLEKPVMGR